MGSCNIKKPVTGSSACNAGARKSIPKDVFKHICGDYVQVRRKSNIKSLTSVEDYVYGAHNPVYTFAVGVKLNKHPHQYRIPTVVMQAFINGFKAALPALNALHDFDSIYCAVQKIAGTIPGVGSLLIYDAALRYAVNRGIYPDYVYLPSANGPLHGAKRYFNRVGKTAVKVMGGKTILVSKLNINSRVEKSEFSRFFSYSCLEIEDILCIYHGIL